MQALSSIRIATRQSPLAMWQAEYTKKQILKHWPDCDITLLPMKTTGDKFLNTKLLEIGGKRLFVKELEEALLDHRADIAVHSMKDVPAELPDGLILTTIFARQNPLDALVSDKHQNIAELPKGAIIGTSSLRRAAQIKAHRPDLKIQPIRGNVGTRLKKATSGAYDAILLAAAGLERLGLQAQIKTLIPDDIILPAAGQGALGIECRSADHRLRFMLKQLHDDITATCVQTERDINLKLGGNCHTPVAVYCKMTPDHQNLDIKARVASPNGDKLIEATHSGATSHRMHLVEETLEQLQTQGVFELMDEISRS